MLEGVSLLIEGSKFLEIDVGSLYVVLYPYQMFDRVEVNVGFCL